MVHIFNKSQLTEEMLFRVAKELCKYVGIWPEFSKSRIIIQSAIFDMIFIFINICEYLFIAHHFYVWIQNVNWFEIVDTIGTTTIVSVTATKSILIAVRQESILEIITYLKKAMLDPDVHPETKKFYFRQWKIAFGLNLSIIFFGLITVFGYIVGPILMNIIRIIYGIETIWKMPFLLELPWSTIHSPGYQFGYLLLSFTSSLCVAKITAVDGLFITVCLYLSAQFNRIQKDIKFLIPNKLGYTKHLTKFTNEQNEKLLKELRRIIVNHSKVIYMSDQIVTIFMPVIMVYFMTASLLICFTSVALIVAPPANAPTFVFFLLTLLFQLFIYCAGGTCIMESSTQIANAAYWIEWYKADSRFQRMLSILMLRAQKGSRMKVPFFEASLPTLLTIMSTAGSYITLLRSFVTN